MLGFHCVMDQVLVMEGFFKMLIDSVQVGIKNLCDVIQLIANAAR